MKQKVVINMSLVCHKSRSKALKTAVSVSGVESVELKGDNTCHIVIVVTGEMDAVVLTTLLRKKVGCAELVSVGPADGGVNKPEPEPKPEPKPEPEPKPKPEEKVQPIQYPVPHYDSYVVTVDRQPELCSIM